MTRRNIALGLVAAAAGAIAFPLVRLASRDRPTPGVSSDALKDGLELQRDGRYEDAVQAFTRIIRAQGDVPEAYLFRGISLHNAQRFDDAIRDFTTVLRLVPDNVTVRLYRGDSYLALGRTDSAAQDFEEVVRAAPEDGRLVVAAKSKLRSLER